VEYPGERGAGRTPGPCVGQVTGLQRQDHCEVFANPASFAHLPRPAGPWVALLLILLRLRATTRVYAGP